MAAGRRKGNTNQQTPFKLTNVDLEWERGRGSERQTNRHLSMSMWSGGREEEGETDEQTSFKMTNVDVEGEQGGGSERQTNRHH